MLCRLEVLTQGRRSSIVHAAVHAYGHTLRDPQLGVACGPVVVGWLVCSALTALVDPRCRRVRLCGNRCEWRRVIVRHFGNPSLVVAAIEHMVQPRVRVLFSDVLSQFVPCSFDRERYRVLQELRVNGEVCLPSFAFLLWFRRYLLFSRRQLLRRLQRGFISKSHNFSRRIGRQKSILR